MNDLRVESYGANEVAVKKQSISKRVAVASGAVVLTLGLFGLVGCVDEQIPPVEEPPPIVEEQVPPVEDPPIIVEDPAPPVEDPYFYINGGSGSWFVSVLEGV